MDIETRDEFKKVTKTLTKIELTVEKNLSYHKGLQLPERMTKAERQIEKKASWKGLYLAGVIILAIIGVVFTIANVIPKP